jgi:hypothetical protein
METRVPETDRHCGYCGRSIAAEATSPARFGERFCSDAHADEFVAGVRAARAEAIAARETGNANPGTGAACASPISEDAGWRGFLKRAACWGAPLLVLLAVPLFWSGGWVATGGSLLSALALLACPLSMYFIMRGMMTMQHPPEKTLTSKEVDHA